MAHTISDSLVPDDIEEYAGRWVAIRVNTIVAAAATLQELFEDPEYNRATDAVYPVPGRGEQLITYLG